MTFPDGSSSTEGREGSESAPADGLLGRAVTRAKEGDASALHFLYVRYADQVQGYVASIVCDHHEAEDITQDVFAKLMRALSSYEPREVPFAAWIMRVARNAAVDHLRRRRQTPVDEVRLSSDDHEQIGFERSQALRTALDQLPSDQREVLVLRHLGGLRPCEIAERLDRSEASVHGLHHRGRITLRAALSQLEAAPAIAAG